MIGQVGQGRTEECVRMSHVDMLVERKASPQGLCTEARACLVCLGNSQRDNVAEAQKAGGDEVRED